MRKLSILLLLANFSAFAQVVVSIPGVLTDCKSSTVVNVTVMLADTTSVYATLIADNVNRNSACPPTNANTQAPIFVVTRNAIQIPTDALLAPVCTTNAGLIGVNAICIYKTDQTLFEKVTYQYDTTPNSLSDISLSAGNERITVTIDDHKSSTANYNPTYQVCYGATQADIAALTNTTSACPSGDKTSENASKNITVTGLTNRTTYWVVARVKGSSNQWSASKPATPELTYGFGKVYDGAPNQLSFSCTQTSAGPGTWMLFLLLGIFLRRPSRRFLYCFAMLAMTISIPALAELGQVNFGIIGSTYKPNLDGSTKADGSQARQFYGTMFEDKLLPLMGVEVDVHLLDDFGSLQLGVGLQYACVGGSALQVDPNGILTNNRSSDSVGLHMLYLKPQLTYILDSWVDTVPLAPYVRGGILAMGYMFRYQGGIDREQGGVNPMGFMFGWEAAAGLMLAIDWMEPSVSKAARANNTYDHIYLKAEAAYMPINNFHQNGLNFSPAWPKQDLPLMLTFGLVFEFK